MAAWQNPENFAIWLGMIIGITVLLLLTFLLFTGLYFKRILAEKKKLEETEIAHQKALLHDSILVQERERTRIAADLHDGLISKLNISLLTLNTTADIQLVSQMLQDSIVLSRHISHDLSPPLLKENELIELLQDFIHPLNTDYTLQFKHTSSKPSTLNEQDKLQIFRIAQEVIQNIIKHAEATAINIYLRETQRYIALQIQDDGKGIPADAKKGLGQKNISLRTQILQAKFRFSSNTPKGTTFLFYLKRDA